MFSRVVQKAKCLGATREMHYMSHFILTKLRDEDGGSNRKGRRLLERTALSLSVKQ